MGGSAGSRRGAPGRGGACTGSAGGGRCGARPRCPRGGRDRSRQGFPRRGRLAPGSARSAGRRGSRPRPPVPGSDPGLAGTLAGPSRDRPEPSGRVAGRHPGNAGCGQACRHAAASGPRPGGAGPAGDPGTARRGRGVPEACGHGREASQAAGNTAAARRGLQPRNRDGANPHEPRGLAGSGTPRGGRVARPRPELGRRNSPRRGNSPGRRNRMSTGRASARPRACPP